MENLHECDPMTQPLSLQEILKEIPCPILSCSVGKEIKKIFKSITIKRKRCKNDWTTKEILYYGLAFRPTKSFKELMFSDISTISKDFFLIEKNMDITKLGYISKYGNMDIFIQVVFHIELSWCITVFQKTLWPTDIGLKSNLFELKEKSIEAVLTAVKQLKFCEGVSLPPCTDQETTFPENILKEMSHNGIAYRSVECKRVISFKTRSGLQSCQSCLQLLRCDKSQSSVPLELTNRGTNNACNPLPEEIIETITDTNSQNKNSDTESDTVTLCPADAQDMNTILGILTKDCPPEMIEFLQSQKRALEKSKYANRWSKTMIRTCLTLWSRSPRAYLDLKSSGFMILPSQRQLQYYKNKVHQKAGVTTDLLHWMKTEAESKNIPPEGYEGGLALDEMSIQSDLQFYCKDGEYYLTGFTEISEESNFMEQIKSGKQEIKLGTHVLQFVFLGFTGFRFPLFHYPTNQASACDIYLELWRIVDMLNIFGFTVKYVSVDGAETNRDLGKILMGDFNSQSPSMKIQNIFSMSPNEIFFIMDYSHVIKKVRNNIYKSGNGAYKKNLYSNGHFIYWNHLYSAHVWDVTQNPFPVHRKLSHEHFFLSSEAKMRNHLAEEVLNKEMLHLMQLYSESLEDSTYLQSTIKLLQHTSLLISNFRDQRPITDSSDARLKENMSALQWFKEWEESVKERPDKDKCLMSHQTRADLTSLIIGFNELCQSKLKKSSASIIPNRVNSDIIENIFCQQRGLHNGNNTNPNYLTYCRTMNAIILGQPTVSRKSNAGMASREGAAPFSK